MGKILFKALAILCAVTVLVIPLDISAQYENEEITKEITDICSLIASIHKKPAEAVRIMSYNIQAEGRIYGGTPCESRQNGLTAVLREISPDILCLQEVCREWFTIINMNTDYTAVNSMETEIAELMTVMYYNEKTTELKEWGDEFFDKGGDYRMRRAVWGLFRMKDSGSLVCVVNTHFNVTKDTNNYSGAQAMTLISVIENLRQKFTCPIFIVGDFNAKRRTTVTYPSSSIYEILTSHFTDTSLVAEAFSAGDVNTKPTSTVDHIFFTGDPRIIRYVILSNKVFLNISDHYPIFIDATHQ